MGGVLKPLMTEAALGNLSMIGSILIFCVGVNLVWGKKLRVANMLPAVVLAVAAAFLYQIWASPKIRGSPFECL